MLAPSCLIEAGGFAQQRSPLSYRLGFLRVFSACRQPSSFLPSLIFSPATSLTGPPSSPGFARLSPDPVRRNPPSARYSIHDVVNILSNQQICCDLSRELYPRTSDGSSRCFFQAIMVICSPLGSLSPWTNISFLDGVLSTIPILLG